jgi:hypothetical protein
LSNNNEDFLNSSEDELADKTFSDEALAQFGREYLRQLSESNDDDYEINTEQKNKFLAVVLFFYQNVKKYGGKIDPIQLIPRAQSGDITAYFKVFYIGEKDINLFGNIIKSASALSIDATNKGEVCISVTVPNVFVKKKA